VKRFQLQVVVLVVLVAVGVYLVWRAVHRVSKTWTESAVCEAVSEGDLERALVLGERLAAEGLYDPSTVECHCAALAGVGQADRCVELIEELLARPEAGTWLPNPTLSAVVVAQRSARGELPGAADLAHRAALRYPDTLLLLQQELKLRSQLEDDDAVLREMIQRLPSVGSAAPGLRLQIAQGYLASGLYTEALAMAGDSPPGGPDLTYPWFDVRTKALAGLGRTEELLATTEEWKVAGGQPAGVDAQYAMLVSLNTLKDPRGVPTLELLRRAVEQRDHIESENLKRGLHYRLIGTLVVDGHYDEAEAELDRAVAEFGEFPELTKEDIFRSRDHNLLERTEVMASEGTLLFQLSERQPGDRVLLSAPPSDPVDSDYWSVALSEPETSSVTRATGVAPVRWVLHNADGLTVGSGTVWPAPDLTVTVRVERRDPAALPPPYQPRQRPGDARLRIVVAVLDCGDWRLVQYLRARGELPVLDHLVRHGQKAVLISDPPFTAAAIRAIANPSTHGVSSYPGLLYQIGTEIESMNFVGVNPFGALRWVTAGEDNLFATLGATHLAVANMLRSYGPMQAGRDARVTGPYGRERQISGLRGTRQLSPEEKRRHPGLARTTGGGQKLIEEMAADFDALDALAADAEVDLVMFRLDSLDVFTHTYFAQAVESAQDDGDLALYWFYRYMDERLGKLFDTLDQDDILIVMSDHGIRTALEHDRHALFVATGGQVPVGRITGNPSLRGTGVMLAQLFGIQTAWPETGMEVWTSKEKAF
jgi:tetratricopeptide (TPR) repeat protein